MQLNAAVHVVVSVWQGFGKLVFVYQSYLMRGFSPGQAAAELFEKMQLPPMAPQAAQDVEDMEDVAENPHGAPPQAHAPDHGDVGSGGGDPAPPSVDDDDRVVALPPGAAEDGYSEQSEDDVVTGWLLKVGDASDTFWMLSHASNVLSCHRDPDSAVPMFEFPLDGVKFKLKAKGEGQPLLCLTMGTKRLSLRAGDEPDTRRWAQAFTLATGNL